MSLKTKATTCEHQNNGVKTRCGKRRATESVSSIAIVPTKIFVNEKHIASCLSRLTLDNNNLEDQPDLEEEEELWYNTEMMPRRSQSEMNFASLVDCVNSKYNPRLVLYHELQLGLRKKPILSSLIQDEIKKPQMQVVLWQPPIGSIKNVIENLRKSSLSNVVSKQERFSSDKLVLTTKPFNDPICLLEPIDLEDSETSVATIPSTLDDRHWMIDNLDIETEHE